MKRVVFMCALFLGLFAFTGETKAAVFFSQNSNVAFVPTNAFLLNGGCGAFGVPANQTVFIAGRRRGVRAAVNVNNGGANQVFFQRRGLFGRETFFQSNGAGGNQVFFAR